MTSATYHAALAWLPGTPDERAAPGPNGAGWLARDVAIEVAGGRISAVRPDSAPAPDAIRLPGLTLPGFANAHSHAFHRALRGRTQDGRGTFWTWRDRMYALAARLDPDSYHRLARALFAELALAGVSCIGEFHYLHHAPDGTPYADPNAMGSALIQAARDAGIRITLLDTVYLSSTVDGAPLTGVQQRFGDGSVASWAARAFQLGDTDNARIGMSAHSVRAVPAAALGELAELAGDRPLHLHLSEQRAENEACHRAHGCSPTELLHSIGLLGEQTTVVHATHLTDLDRTLLGDTGTGVCFCPTTERDLADGIGPARELVDAGSPLCLGSDSHAVVDMLVEARAVELHERLRTGHRGHFTAAELLHAATIAGHRALGWTDAGAIAPGWRADLVSVRLDGVRTAGTEPLAGAVFAATAADIADVVVDGRLVAHDGRHTSVDVAAELSAAITELWR
jgi:formiminoglutamate deiminase